MKTKKSIRKKLKTAGIVAAAALILGSVLYIMVRGLGLVDGLDFGAGAYYYADIPNFSAYLAGAQFDAQVPAWLIFVLFLAWGALMYKLWCWLERRGDPGGAEDAGGGPPHRGTSEVRTQAPPSGAVAGGESSPGTKQ